MATAASPALEDGEILLGWLNLIGWRVEIEHEGELMVGVATHRTPVATLSVRGCARNQSELVGRLFEQAMRLLEPHGAGLRRHVVARRRSGMAPGDASAA